MRPCTCEIVRARSLTLIASYRSIYQDIPFHALEEFKQIAPEEARTDGVLADEHQLMLNRLSFELSERQRCATPNPGSFPTGSYSSRLDQKRKELIKAKEALLKESKTKAATMDSVKTHIDGLMKVRRGGATRFCTCATNLVSVQSALEAQKKVSDLVQSNPLPPTTNPSTPAPS